MNNPIRQWWQGKVNATRETRAKAIRNEFDIIERNGSIYLTHDNVAFQRIPSDAKASDIVRQLHTARETAVNYEGDGTDADNA